MTTLRSRLRRSASDDDGVAMITVLLVGMLLTAIGVGSVSIATSNLKNAGRDRVGGGALGAAEAGLAEAVNHLRGASLSCLRPASSCTTPDLWAAHNGGVTVSLPDGRSAKVTITEVAAFRPPLNPVGRYRVQSAGTAGTGPGLRTVQQEITLKPAQLPLAVYANQIQLNGAPSVFQQTVLSRDCIGGREKMDFTDPTTGANSIDAFYGIPAAAHSSSGIYEKACPNDRNRIHPAGTTCNSSYPFDQDAFGAAQPVGSACRNALDSTSYFGTADFAKFGGTDITPLLPLLRSQAIAQGTYFTSTSTWTPPNAATTPHAVLYFKVGKDDTLRIQNELDSYDYSCGSPRSVIVVIDNASVGNGGLHLNSNARLAGALFAPRGNFQYNGNSVFTGPIYANTIDKWNGTAESQLTECFLQNLPPGLLDVAIESYRELDSIG